VTARTTLAQRRRTGGRPSGPPTPLSSKIRSPAPKRLDFCQTPPAMLRSHVLGCVASPSNSASPGPRTAILIWRMTCWRLLERVAGGIPPSRRLSLSSLDRSRLVQRHWKNIPAHLLRCEEGDRPRPVSGPLHWPTGTTVAADPQQHGIRRLSEREGSTRTGIATVGERPSRQIRRGLTHTDPQNGHMELEENRFQRHRGPPLGECRDPVMPIRERQGRFISQARERSKVPTDIAVRSDPGRWPRSRFSQPSSARECEDKPMWREKRARRSHGSAPAPRCRAGIRRPRSLVHEEPLPRRP